ncbi:MAG: hypothetical protein KDA65_02720 [Planctomycetaceae bacterium]|nr:hypothetical protein [Planctomycetaceae bacterium]
MNTLRKYWFILVGVVLFPLLGIGYIWYRDYRHEQTLETIKKLGGRVDFHDEKFRSSIGLEYKAIRTIRVSHPTFDGRLLGDLRNLNELEVLDLDDTAVDNELGLLISRLNKLRVLSLERTNVTDGLLPYLADIENLKVLDLGETQITDAAIIDIARLKKLANLSLDETLVSDAGMKQLSLSEDLHILNLEGTDITDDGLAEIAKLKKLVYLYLTNTSITDSALRHLGQLKKLTTLDLSHTSITGKSFGDLAGMSHLVNLNLRGTQVTRKNAAQLKQLPDLLTLDLSETPLISGDLVELLEEGAINCQDLRLDGLPVDVDVIKHLKNISNLKYLSLNDIELSDAALEALTELPDIKSVQVNTELIDSVPNERLREIFSSPYPAMKAK